MFELQSRIPGARLGRTDILKRVEAPSALGDWSYEVIDTKLAPRTEAKTRARGRKQ